MEVKMINTICTVIGTTIVLGSAFICILNSHYQTNSQASIEKKELKDEFDKKLKDFKNELSTRINDEHIDVKEEIEKLSNKIDNMTNQYVTVPSFKTYTESISQLLKMMNDKSTHIEVSIDDIREDIGEIFKLLSK